MSALTEGVLNKASRHAELLKSIATLDYVPPALEQQTRHLSDLQSQVKRLTQTLVEVQRTTKKEHHEFLDLKDSTGRKMWSKVTGKKDEFQARINKRKREYVEALEKEMVEKRNVEMLEQMITEALTVKAELSENLEKYAAMKKELQDMYSSLFDGRTEEFPHDDELEQQLAMAESTYARLLAQLNSDSQVVKLLRQAESKMQAAQTAMKEAVEMSFYDISSNSYSVEVMEQSALGQAEFRSSQAKVSIEQARNISHLIQPMPKFGTPTASFWDDVFFDNAMSDINRHRETKAAAEALDKAYKHLKDELGAATSRAEMGGADLAEAAAVLAESRTSLDAFRRGIFEKITEKGDLPTYGEYHWKSNNPFAAALLRS